MKIATWNINGLRARLDFVLAWLSERQPDIVGLQELKLTDDKFPSSAFEELGYHSLSHGQKAWNGVAILSRDPAEVTTRGLADQADFGARLISARVSGIEFSTVYCPNGKNQRHESQCQKGVSEVDEFGGRRVLGQDEVEQQIERREDAQSTLCGGGLSP